MNVLFPVANKASCPVKSPPPQRRANGNLTRPVQQPELPVLQQVATALTLAGCSNTSWRKSEVLAVPL
ncbi:hypothetical protein ACUOAQ_33675, partial [Escherichia sp. SP-MK]